MTTNTISANTVSAKFELGASYFDNDNLHAVIITDADDDQYTVFCQDEEGNEEEYLVEDSPKGRYICHELYGNIYANNKVEEVTKFEVGTIYSSKDDLYKIIITDVDDYTVFCQDLDGKNHEEYLIENSPKGLYFTHDLYGNIYVANSTETKEAVNAENKVNEVKEVTEKAIGFELNTTYKSNNGLGTITVVDIDGLTDDDNQYVLYAKDEEKTEEYLINLSPSYGYFITHEKYGRIYALPVA